MQREGIVFVSEVVSNFVKKSEGTTEVNLLVELDKSNFNNYKITVHYYQEKHNFISPQ